MNNCFIGEFAIKNIMFASLLFSMCIFGLSAAGNQDVTTYSQASYNRAVGRAIGHTLDEYELDVAGTTYRWFEKKWNGEWDQSRFDYAVEKGVSNCQNNAMIIAAKTGELGEKLLKALIVSAGDAAEAFSSWLEKNSERYDK